MIPKSDCLDRVFYRIHSRNLTLGVYRAETGGFLGLREKFGSIYVFEEYHWDNGPPYGTVHPIEALPEVLPSEIQLVDGLGSECNRCNVSCDYIRWEDGCEREVNGQMVPGLWKHLAPTECKEVYPVGVSNKALHEWLETMEKKYQAEGKRQ